MMDDLYGAIYATLAISALLALAHPSRCMHIQAMIALKSQRLLPVVLVHESPKSSLALLWHLLNRGTLMIVGLPGRTSPYYWCE